MSLGYGLSPLAIRRFDRAEIFATTAHVMTRQLRSLAAVDFFLAPFTGFLDPTLDPMGAIRAPTGQHRSKQPAAVFAGFPYKTTLRNTRADRVARVSRPLP